MKSQTKWSKRNEKSERSAEMRNSVIATAVDDEKRQNKRRLSSGTERIFSLNHISAAEIGRQLLFFHSFSLSLFLIAIQ